MPERSVAFLPVALFKRLVVSCFTTRSIRKFLDESRKNKDENEDRWKNKNKMKGDEKNSKKTK
jgi:hypothetical protein